jgi:hypothetical protein
MTQQRIICVHKKVGDVGMVIYIYIVYIVLYFIIIKCITYIISYVMWAKFLQSAITRQERVSLSDSTQSHLDLGSLIRITLGVNFSLIVEQWNVFVRERSVRALHVEYTVSQWINKLRFSRVKEIIIILRRVPIRIRYRHCAVSRHCPPRRRSFHWQ